MTTMSRRGFLGAALATGVAATAGCSTSQSSTGSGKKFNLTIMGQEKEVDAALLQEFLKDKDFGITWVKEDPSTLNAMLAADRAPDLVRGAGGLIVPYLAHRKMATPLDDFIRQSSIIHEDDLQPANDVWRYDGSTQGQGPRYGIAKDFSVDTQWWMRTDLSDAAGVKAPTADKPWSFDDLVSGSAKMTKRKGDRVLRYGMYEINAKTSLLQYMMATMGGSIFSEDASTVDLSSPEAQRAIQWLIDACESRVGYSPLDPNPDGYDWTAMAANRLATAGHGYWYLGQLQDPAAASFRDSCRLLPSLTFGPQRISTTFAATGMWIPEKAKNKEAAFQFLEFHTCGADAEKRATAGWGIPALKSLEPKLPSSNTFEKDAIDSFRSEIDHTQVLTFSPYAQTDAMDVLLAQDFLPILKGSKKAADFADKVTPKLNQLLADGKR